MVSDRDIISGRNQQKRVLMDPDEAAVQCRLQGSDNGGKGIPPRMVDLRLVRVLAVVLQLVLASKGGGDGGNIWQGYVLLDHLSPFFGLWRLTAARLDLGLYPKTRVINWRWRLVLRWL